MILAVGVSRVHIYSRSARVVYAVAWSVLLLATLGGMFDPTNAPDEVERFPGALLVALEAVLVARSLRLGLVLDELHLVSRGLIRTRSFPRSSVDRVSMTDYSGNITPSSSWVRMLRLRVGEKSVDLPHVVGSAKTIRRLRDDTRVALGSTPGAAQ
jgi:hypothetical protein